MKSLYSAPRTDTVSVLSRSVMSTLRYTMDYSLADRRPWDSPGKSTGVGNHFLLQGILPTWELNPGLLQCRRILCHLSHQGSPRLILCACYVAQSCPTLWNPVGCSPPGSSVHGILQARILERVAMPSSRGSSPPRDQTWVSCLTRFSSCQLYLNKWRESGGGGEKRMTKNWREK